MLNLSASVQCLLNPHKTVSMHHRMNEKTSEVQGGLLGTYEKTVSPKTGDWLCLGFYTRYSLNTLRGLNCTMYLMIYKHFSLSGTRTNPVHQLHWCHGRLTPAPNPPISETRQNTCAHIKQTSQTLPLTAPLPYFKRGTHQHEALLSC